MSKRIIYSCVTLKKELENVIAATGFDGEVHFLSEKLHSSPQTMHQVLQQHIDEAAPDTEEIIICVSGCGKSTVGLKATTAPLALPRTMDCIDVLLSGSGTKRPEGAIFLTDGWMNFMKASALNHEKMLAEKGAEATAETMRKIYRGFTDFYIIDTHTYDTTPVKEYIMPLVEMLDGTLNYIDGKYQVLYKLLDGTRDKDVISIPKDGVLDISEFDGLRPAVIKK